MRKIIIYMTRNNGTFIHGSSSPHTWAIVDNIKESLWNQNFSADISINGTFVNDVWSFTNAFAWNHVLSIDSEVAIIVVFVICGVVKNLLVREVGAIPSNMVILYSASVFWGTGHVDAWGPQKTVASTVVSNTSISTVKLRLDEFNLDIANCKVVGDFFAVGEVG